MEAVKDWLCSDAMWLFITKTFIFMILVVIGWTFWYVMEKTVFKDEDKC